jgi:hypothetical protein
MDEWLSKDEIEAKFMHISKHSLPLDHGSGSVDHFFVHNF